MLRHGLLLIAVIAPPVVLRLAQMTGQGVHFAGADLRGFLSDVIFSLAIYALVIWLARRARPAAALLILGWCLLNFGNYEHISTLGASADFGHIAYFFDKTFFFGSVLSLSSPLVLLLLLGGLCGLVLAAFRMPQTITAAWPFATVACLGVIALSQLPPGTNAPDWRQANVIEENTLLMLRRPKAGQLPHLSKADTRQLTQLYASDLSGKPITELAAQKRNVLLVILEGISGIHLESLAEAHGINNNIKLSALDQSARKSLAYSTFISHNRQTNRGEYAILCGDLPVLINAEPKMTTALGREYVNCLPNVLRNAGYRTAYLQAAPLGFMSKDSFMPKAGFEEVYGDSWFAQNYARNQWGIDDRAFLLQSTKKIAQLQRDSRPWFLTLLTVGTHHPYIVPPDFGERDFPTAAQYTDRAFGEFLAKIESMGVLDNTLVIITSDESVGISGYRGSTAGQEFDDITRKLADNWGFLIALTPPRDRQRIDTPFAQVDISLSVLDYLGLTHKPNNFIGRSLFRQYDSGRPIVFGNLYKKYLGAFDARDELLMCPQGLLADCERFAVPEKALFSPGRKSLGADPDAAAFFHAVVAASEEPQPGDRTVALSWEKQIPLYNSRAMQVIFGGQYVSTLPHSLVSVELDVTLNGPPGKAQLGILLQSDHGTHFGRTLPPLSAGDRLTLSFDYYSPEALDSLALIGTVVGVDSENMALDFALGQLRIVQVPVAQQQEEAGLSIHRSAISPVN